MIEASTTPDKVDELLREARRLLLAHADTVSATDLERARNQIAVRMLRARERPLRRLEDSAQDLFVHGRVRPRAEVMARIASVDAGAVRAAFARMLESPPAIAIAGKVPKGVNERVREIVEGHREPAVAPRGRGVPRRARR